MCESPSRGSRTCGEAAEQKRESKDIAKDGITVEDILSARDGGRKSYPTSPSPPCRNCRCASPRSRRWKSSTPMRWVIRPRDVEAGPGPARSSCTRSRTSRGRRCPSDVSILKMTLFQSISKPVGAMPRMAILPPLFIVSIMSRKAGAAPDISRPTSKPSFMPIVAHHVARASPCEASTTCSTPSLRASVEPRRVDVGDDDLARADALRDQRAHDADRPGAGDQHVLADQVEGERGVHGIAERIEDRGDLVGDVVGDRHDIVLRDREIFAEGARPVDADAERVAAEMAAAGAAVAAMRRRRCGPRRRRAGRPCSR